MRRPSPNQLAHLLLFLVVALWGSTFVIVKNALHDASPLVFNLLRMTLATAALAMLNRRQVARATRKLWLAGTLAGLFLAAGYQFQTLGLARTTAAKAAFLTGLIVVLVPILTLVPAFRPATQRGPGLLAGFGTLLAFAGLILLTTPPGTAPRNFVSSIGIGDLLVLCCALAFAAHLLALSRASTIPEGQASTASPGVLATMQIGTATVVMFVTLPIEGHHRLTWSPALIFALLITGLLGTAAAFTIQSFAQQHLPATHTAVILTLEPVFAWITSTVFLGERLSHRALAGAFLILAGIATTEFLGNTAQTSEIPA